MYVIQYIQFSSKLFHEVYLQDEDKLILRQRCAILREQINTAFEESGDKETKWKRIKKLVDECNVIYGLLNSSGSDFDLLIRKHTMKKAN